MNLYFFVFASVILLFGYAFFVYILGKKDDRQKIQERIKLWTMVINKLTKLFDDLKQKNVDEFSSYYRLFDIFDKAYVYEGDFLEDAVNNPPLLEIESFLKEAGFFAFEDLKNNPKGGFLILIRRKISNTIFLANVLKKNNKHERFVQDNMGRLIDCCKLLLLQNYKYLSNIDLDSK